jgi:formylglycine-generating enzyme required for sulfatase activity
MLLRRGFLVFIVLAVIFGLSGCGKKTEEEIATTAAPAKPVVNTGEMVLVPAGEAIIGADNKEAVSYPQHKVNIPAFWIDKYEVTNFQMLDFSIKERYTGEGAKEGKDWRVLATPDKALVPVQYVTFNDAEAYCKSVGRRLPTEEEWEYAARGSKGYAYPWGNDWTDGKSNTAEASVLKPVNVGEYDDVSEFGAHDMLGNVREWTSSWYSTYPGNPKKDPNSGKQRRVVRGLSPNHRGTVAHLYDRDAMPPAYLGDIGFRCAKDATPEEAAKAPQAK